MSERYSKVFALSENLYATGSPIVIEAGALQKDNQTGSILAQIKMKNISAKVIKAVKVKLTLFDVAGNVLADGVEQQYLDLSVSRDESFGSKSAIRLKESTTRSFSVNITEVVFEDGNVWSGTANLWETLSEPAILIDYFNDEELEKQFEIKYGSPCNNVLLEEKDLWYCACGALNKDNEPKCHKCGKSLKALKELDISALKSEKEKRLENERILAEEKAERERKEAEIAKIKADAIKKRSFKIAAIVVPVVCAVLAVVFIFTTFVIPTIRYNRTKAVMESARIGDSVKFGSYEQDIKSNGQEEIEWIVLEKTDDKLMLISKYALDCQPYHTSYEDVTWETCSLRAWLNNKFLNTAFSKKEIKNILTVTVSADKNPEYDTDPGKATQDKVYLLSLSEIKKYFPNDSGKCMATEYTGNKGVFVMDDWRTDAVTWWSRTPGKSQRCVAFYDIDGSSEYGEDIEMDDVAIRPAIWVSLD